MSIKTPIEKATQFGDDYSLKIESLGYSLLSGLNVRDRPGTIDAIISPNEGSPDPIDPNLFTKIKNQILPSVHDGLPVNVMYDSDPIKLQ